MDKMLAVADTMSGVGDRLNRIQDDIISAINQVIPQPISPQEEPPDREEDVCCTCCPQLEKAVTEAVEGCDVQWVRRICRLEKCSRPRGRYKAPPPTPSPPPMPEDMPGPSRPRGATLRFKTRTRSFRNVLY